MHTLLKVLAFFVVATPIYASDIFSSGGTPSVSVGAGSSILEAQGCTDTVVNDHVILKGDARRKTKNDPDLCWWGYAETNWGYGAIRSAEDRWFVRFIKPPTTPTFQCETGKYLKAINAPRYTDSGRGKYPECTRTISWTRTFTCCAP